MRYQFKYEQVLETLSIVSAKDDLNQNNIIEKIKEELRSRTLSSIKSGGIMNLT
ncbi:MAG: hypothetical protein ACR5K2_02630 [Wolbachia sp.]